MRIIYLHDLGYCMIDWGRHTVQRPCGNGRAAKAYFGEAANIMRLVCKYSRKEKDANGTD